MPAHYVYRDPNKTSLSQGDILQKTPELVAHLEKYHAYYANHTDYKFFMVTTQTCDLVLREGVCGSPYITIAAVRPVEEVLRREAAKYQTPWQREARVIGAKTAERLVMFLTTLLDNNQDGYFYLHQDIGLGIHQSCCAFLPLSVSLKIEHYQLCLAAKIAELTDTFQAKLGSLIGHMYNRVAAPEWNEHYPENHVGTEASRLLKKTLITINEDKIAEGVNDLKKSGKFETMKPEEIKSHLFNFKIVSRRDQFEKRAVEVFSADGHQLVDLLRPRMQKPLKADPELSASIDKLLEEAGVAVEKRTLLRDELIHKFMEKLREHFTDAKMGGEKKSVVEKLFKQLMQDATIRTIMSDRV